MSFRLARLGAGERVIGIGAILLLFDLFALAWFAYRPQYHATAVMLGQRVSANGWQTFEVVGPLALIVCVAALAICWLSGTRRSPALPVAITTLLAPIALALVVVLVIRVLVDPPSVHLLQAGGANVLQARPGAYIGLALSVAIFVGTFLSLRQEGVRAEDSTTPIETLSVEQPRAPAAP